MKNTNIPYTIKPNGSIVLYIDGECETIANDHPNYSAVLDAVKTRKFENISELVNVSKAVTEYGSGKIAIKNGEIYYGEFRLHSTLTDRILKMMSDGFDFKHMVKFLENLLDNPSNRAVNETYAFLENYGLPITDDGCFLAYKAVRNDYTDIYSGKFDNSIGKTVSMPRNMVDEVYERDCSTGLHVGALDYVVEYGHFVKGAAPTASGNRLLIVKVNPKNVVSVPKYEKHPKMRVSEYVVVSEIKDVVKELAKVVYKSDATEIAPDRKYTAAKNINLAPKVDTTSPWNASKYAEGWEVGCRDVAEGQPYGTSRDYSEENSYRIGYNDAYNGRPNKLDFDGTCSGCCPDCDCEEHGDEAEYEEEYEAGYEQGRRDAEDNLPYQENLSIDAHPMFKNGYEDGYNE